MSELRCHAEDYLRLRRSLGFKLRLHGPLLAQFMDYSRPRTRRRSPPTWPSPLPSSRRASSRSCGTPAQHGTRLRPVHAGDRPGDRDPAP